MGSLLLETNSKKPKQGKNGFNLYMKKKKKSLTRLSFFFISRWHYYRLMLVFENPYIKILNFLKKKTFRIPVEKFFFPYEFSSWRAII